MAFKAITVNTPPEEEAHIYAQDDAAIYQGIVGSDGVFNLGNKFKSTILSNNSVRVSDGLLCVGGHMGRMEYADYQDLMIENGVAGYNRNDIILARFSKEGNTDRFVLDVKKGVAVTGIAQDPEIVQGSLYKEDTEREYPLWRVRLAGLSILAVEQMFTIIPTIPELKEKLSVADRKILELQAGLDDVNTDLGGKAPLSHTHTKDQVGLGNVDNTADKDKSVNYADSAGNATTVGNYSISDIQKDAQERADTKQQKLIMELYTASTNGNYAIVNKSGYTLIGAYAVRDDSTYYVKGVNKRNDGRYTLIIDGLTSSVSMSFWLSWAKN